MREYPMITSCMILGGIAGCIAGHCFFGGYIGPSRMVACVVVTSGWVGISTGFVVGVLVHLIVAVFFCDDKKKRK